MKEIVAHILNRQSDEGDEGVAAGSEAMFGNAVTKQGPLEIMKGAKGQPRWFRLQGLELKYFAKQDSGKESGLIDLDDAEGCRPSANTGRQDFLIALRGGQQLILRANSDEDRGDWIQAITQALVHKQAAAELDEEDHTDESIRLLEHRFRLLQDTEHENFSSVQKFLQWRNRQAVIFAAGISHNIDLYKTCYNAFEASLETTQNKLFNQWNKLLKNETDRRFFPDDGSPPPMWTDSDSDDYGRRLQVIDKLIGEALDVAVRASRDDSYMDWYPLHVTTALYERLLIRSCFEDPDFGGAMEDNADVIILLLKEMSVHLGFVDGVHDICLALALLHQYKVTKEGFHLEQLESIVRERLESGELEECLKIRCVQLQLQLVEEFCESILIDYHQVEDSSHLGALVQIFVLLQGTKRISDDTDIAESVGKETEERLSVFITQSLKAHYKRVKVQVWENCAMQEQEGARQAPFTPMEQLKEFVDVLKDEVEAELVEFSAYIGVHHPTAAALAARTVADDLNVDLQEYFKDVQKTDAEVMDAWASIRAFELKILEAMESCGIDGSEAKVLKVDEAMESIAADWIEEQTNLFEGTLF
eukprot:SAG31_NODE_1162_length_9594_cov_3.045498_8_plen_590_part_00